MPHSLRYISQVLNPSARITVSPSWRDLPSISQKEGLSFLFYRNMVKKDISIPLSIKEILKQEYIRNWGRNIRIFEELATLLYELKIPIIVLKGAALLLSVYDDVGLRTLGDVDILVRPENVSEIDKVLTRLGYRSYHGLRYYRISNYLNSLLYWKNGSLLLLHLHWHLTNNALPNYIYVEKINMEKIWREAVSLKAWQVDTLCLAGHHQLLHLSEHAMKHSYNTLIHIWDIHQVINRWGEKLDWERVCRDAEEFQLKGPLFYSLWLGREYFNTRVPQEILEFLNPRCQGLGERIFSYLLMRNKRREKFCWLFYFSNISGWRKKIKFVFYTLFSPINVLMHMEGVENGRTGGLCWKVALRRLRKAAILFSRKQKGHT